MDKYKRYTGVIIFLLAVAAMLAVASKIILPQYNEWNSLRDSVTDTTNKLEKKTQEKKTVERKLKKLHDSVLTSQKKIYSPVENNLGDDTLFFTLYSDLIEMVRANTVKIKSIDYNYNPEGDSFVNQKGSMYFVCDVNMEVISNYVNLGKLIQDIYQYPYYIRINDIDVVPYEKDKKILLTTLSVRLYAHTSPDELLSSAVEESESENAIDGATTPLPQ